MMDDLSFEEFFQVNPGFNGEQNLNSTNTYIGKKHPCNKKIILLKGVLLGVAIVLCISNKDKILDFFFGKRNEESEPEDIKI